MDFKEPFKAHVFLVVAVQAHDALTKLVCLVLTLLLELLDLGCNLLQGTLEIVFPQVISQPLPYWFLSISAN